MRPTYVQTRIGIDRISHCGSNAGSGTPSTGPSQNGGGATGLCQRRPPDYPGVHRLDDSPIIGLGVALMAIGWFMMVATRRREEDEEEVVGAS
ncbi:MAG: hypothetical protein R2706_09755 [Acidimicrobiales bacterium]